jgi:hypothetical protein
MATNKSTGKVRVSKILGSEGTIGLIDPKQFMHVYYGQQQWWIKASGTGRNHDLCDLVSASGGTKVVHQAYPHDLILMSGIAVGSFNWPNNSTDIQFGHRLQPAYLANNGSGDYQGGDSVTHLFQFPAKTD